MEIDLCDLYKYADLDNSILLLCPSWLTSALSVSIAVALHLSQAMPLLALYSPFWHDTSVLSCSIWLYFCSGVVP